MEDMLKKDGIPSRFTKTQSETRSCINILAEDESSTEYLEPGAPVSEEEIQQFLEDFDRIGLTKAISSQYQEAYQPGFKKTSMQH